MPGAGVKKSGNRFAVTHGGTGEPIKRGGKKVTHPTRAKAEADAAQTTRRVLGPGTKGAAKKSMPKASPHLKK